MRGQLRRGTIKGILAVLISMGIPIFINPPTFSADWKFLQKNEKGEFFYDAENMIISSEQTIGVWLKVVYSVTFKEQEGLKDLHQTIGFWEIRCKERKIRLLLLSHVSEEKGEEARMSSFIGALALCDLVKTTLGPKVCVCVCVSISIMWLGSKNKYAEW